MTGKHGAGLNSDGLGKWQSKTSTKSPGNLKHHNFKKEGRKWRKCRKCRNSQERVVRVFYPSCAPPVHTWQTSSMQAAERGFSTSSRSNQTPRNSGGYAGKADPAFQHHGDWFTGPRPRADWPPRIFGVAPLVPQASHLPYTIPAEADYDDISRVVAKGG